MAGMALVEGSEQAISRQWWVEPEALQEQILHILHRECRGRSLFLDERSKEVVPSSVMLLLGRQVIERGSPPETCIILNKRSRRVRQAGDLCCPGGTVECELDPYLARLLTLPGSPLVNWPYWAGFRRERPQEARLLSLLLATGLRESWEEMRLTPFFVRFLGLLPSQQLVMYHRIIYPMVGWVSWQKRFVPSWEVEKIVCVPLKDLLRPEAYARYRLYVPPRVQAKYGWHTQDFPCFIHQEQDRQTEILWGATFKIVTFFLRSIFGFTVPEVGDLVLVPGLLDEGYMFGRD